MSLPAPSDAMGAAAAAGATAPRSWEMGWYPDPFRRHQSRFYDGEQWTEHVADGGFSSLDSEPVADLPRSRPRPRTASPPEGLGPRVLPADRSAATLDAPLLLLDGRAGLDGQRALTDVDDLDVGRIRAAAPSWPRRLVRSIVAAPSTTTTTLVVEAADGTERLRVHRPLRRLAPVVDVVGPSGPLGQVEADRVRQGLHAAVRSHGGDDVGHLEQAAGHVASRRVVSPEGVVLARLTAVWDVPGPRRHIPPGFVLLDRTGGGVAGDPAHRDLVLGALVAVDLLEPPPPPRDR